MKKAKEKLKDPGLKFDILTIISISVIVYVIQNVLHEFVGHGGATLLVGGKLISLTTAYLESDLDSVSVFDRQVVAAAGPIVNILIGLLFWGFLKKHQNKQTGFTFFLWLSMAVNLLTGTGYFLFSGIMGIGDWDVVIKGIEHYWFWRIFLIIIGMILYLATVWISLRELNLFIGDDEPNRSKRAFRLSFIPYISGSISATIGSVFNPISMLYILTSAASTLGGTSALAWMTQLYSTKWFPRKSNMPMRISRNWIWIILSILVLIFHIFVIGPSIKF